ncbi:MAG: DoxX family protein [Bacteroidetes bacterium]|nr:DoxX family protein [Bacteroidota bacterium]
MWFLSNKKDLGLLIIRIGFGFGFIYFHGWGKLMDGPERWERVGGAMANIGIGFGHTFWGFMAALTETLGALMFCCRTIFQACFTSSGFYYAHCHDLTYFIRSRKSR